MKRLTLGSGLAGLLALYACAELKVAPSVTDTDDASGDDGTGELDAAADAESAGDVGSPPPDFSCGSKDAWTQAKKSDPNCAARQVFDLDKTAFEPDGIAITGTKAGRIAVAFTSFSTPDESELRFIHFVPSNAASLADGGVSSPRVERVRRGIGLLTGLSAKLASTGNDTIVVLSHDPDASASGDVVLRKLVDGKSPLLDDGVFATGIKPPTKLGLVSDSAGTLTATVLTRELAKGGGETGTLLAFRRLSGGAIDPLPSLVKGLILSDPKVPGIGETSLFATPTNQLHALYHFSADGLTSPSSSKMRHHTLDGSTWSSPKSVASEFVDAVNGYSPNLTVVGTKKIVTYVSRASNQGPSATAELKVARWEQKEGSPTYETITPGLDAENNNLSRCRVAAAVDKYGLEHIVYFFPTGLLGTLAYARQTRTANGGTVWLNDVIDNAALDGADAPWVALYIDDHARPHIAYVSGEDGRVRYATRFDR